MKTPQFTASAFVRCENIEQKRGIYDALKYLGWQDKYHSISDIDGCNCIFVDGIINNFGVECISNLENDGLIDCGTNTDLFLELAQMRSDTDKDQWFICTKTHKDVDHYEWYKGNLVKSEDLTHDSIGRFRRATPEEVFNHLKSR